MDDPHKFNVLKEKRIEKSVRVIRQKKTVRVGFKFYTYCMGHSSPFSAKAITAASNEEVAVDHVKSTSTKL